MTENDPYSWPGKLYEWLHEYEGHSLRSERLLSDIEHGGYKKIIQWIQAAYKEGYMHRDLELADDGK